MVETAAKPRAGSVNATMRRALSPRSPNVMVSRALEMVELAGEQPVLSDSGSAGNALSARVAQRLKAARAGRAPAHSLSLSLSLPLSPSAALKRKRAASLPAAAAATPPSLAPGGRRSLELRGDVSQGADDPGASPAAASKTARERLLERRMVEAPPQPREAPPKARDAAKHKKKRRVDAVGAALDRFRNEEAPSLSRCFAFSSRFCQPSSRRAAASLAEGADDSDDDVDDTDGESCPVDESGSPVRRDRPRGSGRLRVHVGVALAQGARAYMEDRYSVVERLFEDDTIHSLDDDEMLFDPDPTAPLPVVVTTAPSLFAIYDGHNGAFAADYARDRFREVLSESEELREVNRRARGGPMSSEDVTRVRKLLIEAFETVDDEILARTVRMGKRDGSTVLIGLLVGGKLFVANIGDSRGVFSRSSEGLDDENDHEATRVSVDHKPDLADETARVEAAGGKVVFSGCWRVAHDGVPLRLAISRSLGDHPLKVNLPASCSGPLVSVEPDITVVDVANASNELMVFASDGLWDRLSDNDAVRLARAKVAEFDADEEDPSPTSEALRFAASALVEDALNKRSMDNITAMVVSWSSA